MYSERDDPAVVFARLGELWNAAQSSILNKLQVADRFQAAIRARDARLGEEESNE